MHKPFSIPIQINGLYGLVTRNENGVVTAQVWDRSRYVSGETLPLYGDDFSAGVRALRSAFAGSAFDEDEQAKVATDYLARLGIRVQVKTEAVPAPE